VLIGGSFCLGVLPSGVGIIQLSWMSRCIRLLRATFSQLRLLSTRESMMSERSIQESIQCQLFSLKELLKLESLDLQISSLNHPQPINDDDKRPEVTQPEAFHSVILAPDVPDWHGKATYGKHQQGIFLLGFS
jgi:hypothetical protein